MKIRRGDDDVSLPCKVSSFGKSERGRCGCSSDDVRGKNEQDADELLHDLTMLRQMRVVKL